MEINIMRLLELLKENNDNQSKPPFFVPDLPFAEDAIKQFANGETMNLHRTIHHQAYADGLNEAIKKFSVLKAKTPLQMFDMYRRNELIGEAKQAVANFAGGFVNHSLFWEMLSPRPTKPSLKLTTAINNGFDSMQNMRFAFESAASEVFGSGWAWLVYDPDADALNIMSTSNQINPAMSRSPAIILLGLDMWEHAFYLTHKTNKKAYMKSFWNVVNWDYVSDVYARAKR
jgi:Fe-Mn family superoxide dismutase